MLPSQRPFAVITALALAALIVYLIRRRRLREEYALLWFAVAAMIVVVSFFYPLVLWLTRLIGAVTPTTTLFLFSILFLLIVSIHFSVVNSRLKDQIKDLTQEIALLRVEMGTGEKRKGPPSRRDGGE